jgi:NAD-dependent deacetylase
MPMSERQTLEPAGCAELIRQSGFTVALTGAGLSTAAGIPDFRGPRGIYVTRRYDPEKVFEIGWFRREPRYFYEFSRDFISVVKAIEPTFTHRFLAEMERQGRLTGIVTQNIDLLHQLAGSRKVIELHGSYCSAVCPSCGRRFEQLTSAWWEEAIASSPTPPIVRCPACRGVLKPGIVFFGEMVDGFAEAERMVARCDLLLVLGSSLQVSPASFLPHQTRATTLVVNQGEVMLPPAPNRYFVDGALDEYFREVAGCLAG